MKLETIKEIEELAIERVKKMETDETVQDIAIIGVKLMVIELTNHINNEI